MRWCLGNVLRSRRWETHQSKNKNASRNKQKCIKKEINMHQKNHRKKRAKEGREEGRKEGCEIEMRCCKALPRCPAQRPFQLSKEDSLGKLHAICFLVVPSDILSFSCSFHVILLFVFVFIL